MGRASERMARPIVAPDGATCYFALARYERASHPQPDAVHPPPVMAVPCQPMPDAPLASLIHARDLTKQFGTFTAVDSIDFDVARGESFGFLGPNGAGKTSTMRMIGCVSPITAGTLQVMGMDPATDGPLIRARVGVVPQQDTLDTELT